jgi:glutaredoxin-related protein
MDILYYSNYCKHSQKLLQTLSKVNMADKISFVCIDKRARDTKTNQSYVVLENGGKVVLPPNIHHVPALLLIQQKYKILLGDDILKHLHPQMKKEADRSVNYNGEPQGYFLGGSTGGTNIISEQYTYYNLTPEELSAKGQGGRRQLYNYVSVRDDLQFIPTPPDTYRPDKISTDVTLENLQQKRLDEITKIVPQQQPLA